MRYSEQQCPAYIVERRGKTSFRVHFDFEGYAWEDDVSPDRILGLAEPDARSCAMPARIRLMLGLGRGPTEKARSSPYRVGERLRVRWRGSVYSATVLEVVASDRLRVHYSGHESAWDETITVDRVVNERR